jgi:broad specificity phosphatase PhoE
MVINHCPKLGISRKDYKMTSKEIDELFSKLLDVSNDIYWTLRRNNTEDAEDFAQRVQKHILEYARKELGVTI